MHHSNIDRIWAHWQKLRGTDTYQPTSGYKHNSVNDIMHPLEQAGGAPTPAAVADINELGYTYTGLAPTARFTRAGDRGGRWLVCRVGSG